MNTLGNLIWLLFGSLFSAVGYFVGGIVLCLTIIGIPFGLQCFKLGVLMLWPFGKEVISSTASSAAWPFASIFFGSYVVVFGWR
jgi:uncharacterized membrane protein YccF (DUF307 family)